MKKDKLYILETMPVSRAILHLALPSVLSMMVNILYNLTDTFFIGKLNDPYQVAAVSIALPLFLLQMAIAGIFGFGGGSYLSRLLGKKDFVQAKQTTATALVSTFFASVGMMILGLIFIPHYLISVGASENTIIPTTRYLTFILIGSPFIMLKFAIVQLIRAEGAAKAAMTALFIGTGVNILLDPLFIFVFDMGVTGAAVATVIGNACGLAFCLSYYFSGRSVVKPAFRALRLKWETYREILWIGVPASLSQIMMTIGNVISYRLASVYGDHNVAALGVAARVLSIPIFIFIGMSVGVQPLIGFNYGAGAYRRMKKSIRSAITINLGLAGFFTLIFALFPRQLITVFIKDAIIVDIGTMILEAYVFAIPFAAIGMILMTSLQAMGKALPALIVAISRQGIVYIPLIFVLNRMFLFEGLVFTLPIADAITTSVSFTFVWMIARKLQEKAPIGQNKS